MRHGKIISVLLFVLCFLIIISGCGKETADKKKTWEPVTFIQCIQPSVLNSLYPASGSKVAVSQADYENDRTTVQLLDVKMDAVCHEITLDGVWDVKEQAFSDGRLALCRRETNTWKFLSATLGELGEWNAENVDGFFSYDGNTYYYLRDHVLYRQSVGVNDSGKVILPYDLRLLELTAFDAPSGTMVMQFFLSPYGSECGTAVYNIATGSFTMLQKDRYRVTFRKDAVCLLNFDNEKMGYSVTFGGGDRFFFADAGIFSDTAGDLYTIPGSPYLMGITSAHSTLYAADKQINSCPLSNCGIEGEMHSVCYLPDEQVLVGAVYQEGVFRLYVIDPTQIPFTEGVNVASVASPFLVDEALAQSYREAVAGAPVTESLQDARKYADTLEEKYGVKILLSSQCKDAAALCDRALTLTDTMSADDELSCVVTMLEALDRSLALYPKGFPAQFRNGEGDGGLCFLPVEHIESDYLGCAYERFEWQYIALDVNTSYSPDSVICHEIWHATENHIRSRDYTALPMDEWDALNPKGFSYTGYDIQRDDTYPGLLYTSLPEEIHFVDSYSCVARTEDRARIMEYIMTCEDEARILMKSPFIRKKLQMMCDAVRNTFDTTGWGNVRWERLL